MKLTKENKVGPKTVAFVLAVLGLLALVGGWHTVGIWLPAFTFMLYLIVCTPSNFLGLIPLKIYLLLFVVIVSLGLLIFITVSPSYAWSWFVTAFILSFAFKIVRYIFTGFGLFSSLFNM